MPLCCCCPPQKLKKLIKAQKAHIDQGLEGDAPAEAASGERCLIAALSRVCVLSVGDLQAVVSIR